MAIQFRCDHCRTLMSISSRKAGMVVRCAAGDGEILVPGESAGGTNAPPPATSPSASHPLPPSAVDTIRHASPPRGEREEIGVPPESDPVRDENVSSSTGASERQ